MTVQVVFSRNHTPGSILLRGFLWSPWSHCALVDGGTAIEAAAFHGVRERPALAHRINTAVNGSGASSSGGNGGSRFGNDSNGAGGKVIFTILNFKCRIRGKGLC